MLFRVRTASFRLRAEAVCALGAADTSPTNPAVQSNLMHVEYCDICGTPWLLPIIATVGRALSSPRNPRRMRRLDEEVKRHPVACRPQGTNTTLRGFCCRLAADCTIGNHRHNIRL